jgi:hypothetical protein
MVVDAPPEFDKRLCLEYPALPQAHKDDAVRGLSRLMQAHNLRSLIREVESFWVYG